MRLRSLLAVLLFPAVAAQAQVGFSPAHSPFTEIQHGSFFELTTGHVFGTGGALKLGPRDGPSYGFRYTLHAKNTLQFGFGFWTSQTVRSVIDADDSVAKRDKGLSSANLYALEIGIQLNLSGGKEWHHLAPYAGVSFGFVHGSVAAIPDTSGYDFGNKLWFAPGIGTRWFLSQRLYVKADARILVWNLAYPTSYADEPASQPGTATQSNAVNITGLTSQYTLTPELRIGLGFTWW